MICKVRNYKLVPDLKNPGRAPMKTQQGIDNIIYSETQYFPIKFQQNIIDDIQSIQKKLTRHTSAKAALLDFENIMNVLIVIWKLKYGLTPYKPLFPKENLGVLIGDPFFNFY